MERDEIREVTRRKLYRLFRITDESYITTVQLFYVYDRVYAQAGENTLVVLQALRKLSRRHSNLETLDALYRTFTDMQYALNGRYAPREAKAPLADGYMPGWRL